eukprot:CAMPEP_0184874472 /NCGR_PEP_ID=MMETSP0580-20130426/42419_1 /TAXON_ID=1118495 /ORGANISM="Dactyliosolen fragilissimus" /LENGTH=692 /DNA_ID=CAMNT_0027377499 /DNA_START=547 /DNA_END=2625 /DNA_ORIENTATION=+
MKTNDSDLHDLEPQKNRHTLTSSSSSKHLNHQHLSSMIMLPLLCEKCSHASLLAGDGVLQLISVVLHGTAERINDDICSNAKFDEDDDARPAITSLVLGLLITTLELGKDCRSEDEEEILHNLLPDLKILASPSNDMLAASINSSKKSERAEMADVATHAMTLISTRSWKIKDGSNTIDKYLDNCIQKKTPLESLWETIHHANNDLLSTQPPMRARGIARIRRETKRFFLNSMKFSQKEMHDATSAIYDDCRRSLVVEIYSDRDEMNQTNSHEIDDFHCLDALETMLWIAVDALNDDESYVYLAAIQAIVDIADVHPLHVMPLLGSAATTGILQFLQLTEPISTWKKKHDTSYYNNKLLLNLNSNQRIKLTEAVIFAIRRRGCAILSHVPDLMKSVLYSPKLNNNKDMPYSRTRNDEEQRISQSKSENIIEPNFETMVTIQQQTDSYFRYGSYRKDVYSSNDLDELSDTLSCENDYNESLARLKTGGPVFESEETDILRSTQLSIASEIIAVVHRPSSISQFCSALIRLGQTSLSLDASRSIRRVAALLAREIYSCALRELTSVRDDTNVMASHLGPIQLTMDTKNEDTSFLVALVGCQEEKSLYFSLIRCVNANDVDYISKEGTVYPSIKGKVRLYDPATVVFCKEALETREILDKLGILKSLSIVVENTRREAQDPLCNLLTKEFANNKI